MPDLFELDCECGCAAKIPANRLRDILHGLDLPDSPSLVVGVETLDDAGIYRISDDKCLVQTVDFFPPVARDPFTYGRIAAANSLSDIYAMGGRPLTALAIVCFPAERLGPEVLKEITRGAVDKMREAGVVLLGGHSVVDSQPKYGLAVTGEVREDAILDNAHARPDDILLLTKPLGTGVTIMAAKAGMATREQETQANEIMCALNSAASEVALECCASSCTDITGFGLLGHAMQMARASNVSVEFDIDAIPKIDGAAAHAGMGLLAGAAYANRQYVGDAAVFEDGIDLAQQDLLFDPQTSGGLLIACRRDREDQLVAAAGERISTPWAIVGRVAPPVESHTIRIGAHHERNG
jgi:selenide,water dikinase